MKKSNQPAKMDSKHISVNEVTPLKEPHISHDIEEGEEEEREVSRLEMWTDALASIVATIAILPLMELLKEEESENSKSTRSESGGANEAITQGEEVIQILKSMIFIGAGFYYIGLLLHHNCIAFHWITDTRSHLVYFLALVFMLFLSLSSFGTQSLVNGMINADASAIYIWCVLFGLITGSALLLFIYCIYYTDLPHHVSKNVRLLECLILLSLVVGVGAVASIISFDITYLSMTLPLSLVVPVMTLEIFTNKNKVNEILLPKGYPKERLVLFADGVYAVAITLIVIDIRYTSSTTHAWEFLKDSWQSFVAHAIVFVIVGFHWYLHNVMFNYFQKADGHLFSINILHSALIALFPFCVKFMFVHDYGLYILAPVGCWVLIAASQLLLIAVLKEWILSKRVPIIMAIAGGVLVTLLTVWAILQ